MLANVEDFPDSMAGGTLASLRNAPILLTYKSHLEISVLQQLSFLKPKNVYLLGGPGALSMDIESNLKDNGSNTIRLAGLDRFKTAVAVGEEVMKERKSQGATSDTAFVAFSKTPLQGRMVSLPL